MSVLSSDRRGEGASYLPRDFVEAAEGLLFAVVAQGVEEDRVLSFLRYVRTGSALRKVDTAAAETLIAQQYPQYRFRSARRDVALHGIPVDRITRHYRPAERLAAILSGRPHGDLERKIHQLAHLLLPEKFAGDWLGVTGSVLVGAHHDNSDIDLVAYGQENFAIVQRRLRAALDAGRLDPLSPPMWRETYRRRGCSLSLDEYVWHERRKFNKFSCQGTKVDISCVEREGETLEDAGRKLGRTTLVARVIDDSRVLHYPAQYSIDHPRIRAIICFNPTYTGQARRGETIEASGWIEQAPSGTRHLIIGTSRESAGEYLRVLRPGKE
jgi:uncharacterized protein